MRELGFIFFTNFSSHFAVDRRPEGRDLKSKQEIKREREEGRKEKREKEKGGGGGGERGRERKRGQPTTETGGLWG